MLFKIALATVVPAIPGDPGQPASTYCPPPEPDPSPDPGGAPGNSGPPAGPPGDGGPTCPPGYRRVDCCEFGGTSSCDPVNVQQGCVQCDPPGPVTEYCGRIGASASARPVYIGECS